MANLQVKDATSATKYLAASGAGTSGDPHVPEHLDSNSAAILAAAQAIEAAVKGTLTVTGTVATGGLTDAQLRASAVPVSGTVTVQDGGGSLGGGWQRHGQPDAAHAAVRGRHGGI